MLKTEDFQPLTEEDRIVINADGKTGDDGILLETATGRNNGTHVLIQESGQTLGMKAWRLRLQNNDGSCISKMTGLKRLLPTLLGLGNLVVIFDRKNKLSLQDRLTNTEVVVLSLEANKGRL